MRDRPLMTTRIKQRPALAALTDDIEDMVRDYHPPTDHYGRDRGDARHFAAYLAERMAAHGEQCEESGECCPLCDVVRERCEVPA
jgi:hypothetical protein